MSHTFPSHDISSITANCHSRLHFDYWRFEMAFLEDTPHNTQYPPTTHQSGHVRTTAAHVNKHAHNHLLTGKPTRTRAHTRRVKQHAHYYHHHYCHHHHHYDTPSGRLKPPQSNAWLFCFSATSFYSIYSASGKHRGHLGLGTGTAMTLPERTDGEEEHHRKQEIARRVWGRHPLRCISGRFCGGDATVLAHESEEEWGG